MAKSQKLRVAILGTGKIGTDLLVKVMRSAHLECVAMVGRRPSSEGIVRAESEGIPNSCAGIRFLQDNTTAFELVFDATSAAGHTAHALIFSELVKVAVDLTPAGIGYPCVPAVNMDDVLTRENVNVVTCGGQAAIPIAHAIGRSQRVVDYVEVVSTIAANSAGPATRLNLDEYIRTTELGVMRFGRCTRAKAILNVNPARPCVDMQTTIFATVPDPDLAALRRELVTTSARVRRYVPGYEIIVGPTVENGRITVMTRVRGRGDYLPPYAGNLDIVNCAAVAFAEELARRSMPAPLHDPAAG